MQPAERTAVPETSRGTTQITTSQPVTPATVPAPPTTTPMPSPPTTTAATPTSGATPRAAAQPAIPATPRIVRSFHKSQYRNGTSGRHIAIGTLDQLDPAGSRGRFRKHGRRGGRRRTDRDRRRYRNGSDCRMRTILARADAGTAAHGGYYSRMPGSAAIAST